MKGIILAGGGGTRLYPITYAISKQLLPIYDKPMIYYPLDVLLKIGIRDILIISTKEDTPRFMYQFGSGDELGVHFEYKIQPFPNGLAESFLLGRQFIGSDDVCLILGDNIFFGSKLNSMLRNVQNNTIVKAGGSLLFAKEVPDPKRFGIIEFDTNRKPINIIEKPKVPKSNYAVVGLYLYANNVVEYVKDLKPSERNELEITDLNKIYLDKQSIDVLLLDSTINWLDAGTHESLLDASTKVASFEKRSGHKVGCIEETAYKNGWINQEDVLRIASNMKNQYGDYLRSIINGD